MNMYSKGAFVPAEWLGVTKTLMAEPNLRLLDEVNKRGIDHANLEEVRRVWREIKEDK